MFSSCFEVRKLGEELKDVGLCCGYGVTVELCGGYGRLDHSIKSLKEYSTPLLLIFATILWKNMVLVYCLVDHDCIRLATLAAISSLPCVYLLCLHPMINLFGYFS